MLSVRLQIAIISTRWSTKLARFVPHSTQSSEVECIDSILWKSSWFVPRSTRSSTVETTDSIIHNGMEIHVFVCNSTRPIHTTRNRNLGTGLDLHMRSKDLPRGRWYFTGLMSFSLKSYCLLLSCLAVRLMCIGYQWLSLFSVCLRVSVHLAIPCVH